jgi:rhamnose transport system permease protein
MSGGGRADQSAGDRLGRWALHPDRLKEISLVGIILVALLVFSLLVDGYLSGQFFNRVTTGVAITAVLAAAQTLVIITRNIDLSVGSIVVVTAYVTGEFVAANQGVSPAVAVLLAMAIGGVLGTINGVLVAYARIPAIIVTLGTLAIYRTFLIDYADAQTITNASLPQWLVQLPQRSVVAFGNLNFRVLFVVALVVILLLQWALARLRPGRWLYAIGSNPDAARQAGLPQARTVMWAFIACGILSGLAGFMFLARFGTVTVIAGQALELKSVAAAVVGGVSILGGSGTLIGALLGAILIDTLDQSLVRVPQVSEFWRDAVLGVLILFAVTADVVLNRRFRRRWAAQARPETAVLEPGEAGP